MIMVIADTNTPSVPVSDVVFVIEGTANLVADIKTLKKSYIIPTLEYFNEGPPDPTDYGCDHSSTLYVLVVFHAGDITPEPAAYCTGPTTSIDQFIKWIDDIQFIGGAGEACSHIAEGLSTAVQVFDDMKAVRGASTSFQRHCILVCNSPPYQMTSQESLNYSGYSSEQLANMMGKRGINLSLISPRKIPILQLLFDEGNVDLKNPPMDFSIDPRHHVQLSGFQLQEQSHNAPADEDKQVSENLKTSPAATTNSPAPGSQLTLRAVNSPASVTVADSSPQFRVPGTAPSQVISQQPSVISQQPSVISQQPSPQPTASHPITSMPQPTPPVPQVTPAVHPGNVNSNPVNKTHAPAALSVNVPVVPQVQQAIQIPPNRSGNILPNVNQQAPSQADMTNWNSDQSKGMHQNPITRQGMVPRNQNVIITQASAPPGTNTATAQMMSQSQGLGPVVMPLSFSSSISQPIAQESTPTPSLHPPMPSLPVRDQQRIFIWTGALEWQEKPKAPAPNGPQRLTHSLACRVSIGPNDPEIQASMWPNKLIMQLIPQVLLSQLQSMFHHARSVVFHFSTDSDHTALRNLYTVMGRGFAGCVHFPPVTQCDVRVLMLVYSQKKKTFMGLIPTDQSIFVNGIRTVITEHKKKTIAAAANASNRFQQSAISMTGTPVTGISQVPVSTTNSTMSMAVSSSQTPISSIPQPNPGQSSQLATSQIPSGQIQQGGQSQGGQSTMMENTMRIANLQQTLQTAQKRGLQYQHQAEAAKKALEVAARQQHLLEEMQYYGGPPPNMYSAQQQRMQSQAPQQQPPPQQQTPVTNQQLRHLLLNQQAQQQQQQMRQQMMMRAAAPQPQSTGMPPGGSGQQQPIHQMPPSQGSSYMEDFNIGDLM